MCNFFLVYLGMKTLRTVEITPVYIENIQSLGPNDYVANNFYVQNDFKYCSHSCLCGCGAKITLPVNQHNTGWQLVNDGNGQISLIGSILQHPCESHYIITKNKANFV